MRLGELIRKWRIMTETPLADCAAEIGIAPGVLGKFEQGGGVTGATLGMILAWVMLPIPGPRSDDRQYPLPLAAPIPTDLATGQPEGNPLPPTPKSDHDRIPIGE